MHHLVLDEPLGTEELYRAGIPISALDTRWPPAAGAYDASVPRITLQIEDDALRVAKVHASLHHLTLGEAVSELVRLAADRPLMTDMRNGLRVALLSRRSPKVTTTRVDKLRDKLP